MSEPASTPGPRQREGKTRMSGVQIALLVVSILVMAGGVALGVAAGSKPAPEPQSAPGTSGLASGLVGDDQSGVSTSGAGSAPHSSGEASDWSPAIFRLGFSFFAGFCIAFALRTFLRLTMVVAGVVLLLLFGLQYAGFVEVNWGKIGADYDSFVAWLSAQVRSFHAFITGYLPSSASAAAGLLLGFKGGR
jgi:uncharacterized membrane protein (Fun14 family)